MTKATAAPVPGRTDRGATDRKRTPKTIACTIFRTLFTGGLIIAVLFGVLAVFTQIAGISLASTATVEFAHERVLPIALVGAAVVCIFSLLCTYVDTAVEETDD
ncbi:hypothetical protein ACJEDT_26080 (plasmid) [Rhodococcoides fascians]|uniref:hypothetical protein n=1 Tax=Rhodococcoides fascians TaxID=1828 RepID=UPI00389A3D4D